MDEPLASVSDVADMLGRNLTDDEERRAEILLGQASARFRREARQDFTPGESTVRLRVASGSVFLRQAPVVEVVSVTGAEGQPVSFHLVGQVLTVNTLDGVAINLPVRSAMLPGFVTVHYRHGGDVPADVVGAVAGCVVRVLNAAPEAVQGVAQATDTDSRGPFSRTRQRQFAPWAVGGQLLLSPDDLALARSYRPTFPRLLVMKP
ncbi:MAG: hypothetical protein Q4F65_01060 [Propionibacteriaceae bacterium]|nr:hypothetical protein [Propionibacteriaceae bacterium]